MIRSISLLASRGARFVFLAAILVFSFTLALSQTSSSDLNGSWRHHERQAPSKEIFSIAALPDGRILAGCEKSMHAFDGSRWKKTAFGTAALPRHDWFFSDSRGRLYFLADNRLVIWEDGHLIRYDDIVLYEPLATAEAPDGAIWFGCYNYNGSGVYRFENGAMERLHEGRARSVAVDTQGNVWASVIGPDTPDMRLLSRTGGSWRERTGELNPILPVINNNLRVFAAPDGAVWITNEGSTGTLRNGSWTFVKPGSGTVPVVLSFDRSGRVWGYTLQTLYLFGSDGKWSASRTYVSLLPDESGFIAATESAVYTFDGFLVYKYENSKWTAIESPYDLGSDRVSSIEYMDDGTIVCGHATRGMPYDSREHCGISIFNGVEWRNFSEVNDTTKFADIYQVKRAPDGDIFVYSGDGYYTFDGKTFAYLDSLVMFDVTDVAWDSSGKMWVTTNRGLINYKYPDFDMYPAPQMMNPWYGVYNLCIDDEGYLYMQAIHGHVLYTDREMWYILISDNGHSITDIAVQGDGTVWAARLTDLSRWSRDYGEFTSVVDFPDTNRLVSIDSLGRIWSSSYGKTGYLENEKFVTIPELANSASDVIAYADDGRIALNSFDRTRSEYSGFYEFVPSTVGVHESDRPSAYLSSRAYPNPFNASITLEFDLPVPSQAKVTLYTVTGQRVRILADRWLPAGSHRIRWDGSSGDGSHLSSGLYLYRIDAGVRTATGKMLLVK